MYKVLDEDTIKIEILPHLSTAKRGFVTKGELVEIVNAILYTQIGMSMGIASCKKYFQ